jgi:hypothetical protein
MNAKNEQFVKSAYEAYLRGDLPAVLGSFADDIIWHVPGASPLSGHRRGIDQVRQYFAELDRLVRVDEFDVNETFSNGDKVVVLGRTRATVKASDGHLENEWAHLVTVRDGKIAALHMYNDSYAEYVALSESPEERKALTGPLGTQYSPSPANLDE